MKKLNLTYLLIVLISLLIQSCFRAGPPRKEYLDIVEKYKTALEIEDRVMRYAEACKQLDVENAYDYWADVEGFTMAADGAQLIGSEVWKNQMKEMIDSYEKMLQWNASNINIYVLSDESASCTVDFGWSVLLKSGDTISRHGSWLYVFKKFEDDVWRVVQSGGTHLEN